MKNSNLNHLNQKLKNPNYVVSKIRKNKWNKYNKKSLKELFSLINKLIIQKSKRFIFISLHYYLYPFF